MEVAPNWLVGMIATDLFLITMAAVLATVVILISIYGFNQDKDE